MNRETRKRDVLRVAALVLCALAEEEEGRGAPSGHMYAALSVHGIDLDTYTCALAFLRETGKVEEEHHYVVATPAGRAMAAKLEAVIDAAQGRAS